MTEKHSFVLYTEYKRALNKLNMEQRGQVLTALMEYADGQDAPEMDLAADIAFSFIAEQIDRDNAKWQTTKLARSEAGKKSAEAKATKTNKPQQTPTNVNKSEQKGTNSTVNVNVNVNENVKDNVINTRARDYLKDFLGAYPKITRNILAVSEAFEMEIKIVSCLDEDALIKAAENYAEAVSILKTEERFIKNPDRFIKDGTYMDYLPENYKKPKSEKKKNAFIDHEAATYDFDAIEKQMLGRT